ncbi:glutathione ABC transporter substrate-binding protein GsiB [Aeromicrobium panaciterrae]|uniref:ABC transporter substrate-binding protein n=1 Tax=Aeromicrobium panaciterrae TaxID=363861 RepID=UPI0031DFD928
MKFNRLPNRRALVSLGLAMALFVPLSACSSGDGEDTGSTSNIEYFSAAAADVAKLDPALGSTSGMVGTGALWIGVFDTLVNIAPDGAVEPRLASKVEGSDDFVTWTVTLRSGLTFSDGTPFDAEAVVQHWTRLADPKTGSKDQGQAGALKSITAVDAATIEVTLDEPDAHWPDVLASTALALVPSPTAVEKYGDKFGTSPETTVGAGPFTVTAWRRDDRVTLARSKTYWNSKEVGPKQVVFRYVTDPSLRAKTFSAGEGDIMALTAPGDELVEARKNYTEFDASLIGALAVAVNTREGHPTSSTELRQALAAAVDIDAALKRSAPGAEAITSLYPKSSPYNEEADGLFGDPAKAQDLVDQYLAGTGKSSVSIVFVTNQQYSGVAQALKQDWDKIKGLDVKIEVEQSLLDRLGSRDFDLIFSAFGGGTPRALVDRLRSTEKATNVTGISDPALDDALLRYSRSLDPEAMGEALSDVQASVWEKVPYMPALAQIGSNFARNKDMDVPILTDSAVDFSGIEVK